MPDIGLSGSAGDEEVDDTHDADDANTVEVVDRVRAMLPKFQ